MQGAKEQPLEHVKTCTKNKDATGLELAISLKSKKQEAIRELPVHYACSLCPLLCESRGGLLQHIRKTHKNEEGKKEALAQVPYEVCPHCKEPKSNLWEHVKTCAEKEDATGLGFGNGSSLELMKREAIEKGRQAKLVLWRIDTMLMYEGSNR